MNQENNKYKLSFAALDPYMETNLVLPTEVSTAKGFISWGKDNKYPYYLYDLYNDVATLKSIIDGLTDYVCGESVEAAVLTVPNKTDNMYDLLKKITKDYLIYGGFALNVLRNKLGQIAEVHYLDFKYVRSNEDHTEFYYCKEWNKSFGRVKYTSYPAFQADVNYPSSIFYYSNDITKTYPTPIYGASIIACEIEKCINQYHLNAINNGFSGSYIVNFNGGKPDDEQKLEIEENFYSKFTGYENASRPVLVFNDSKEQEVTIANISQDDFADKYDTLSKRSKQELFTAFRATPNLFGIMTETTGFSEQEFLEAFKLFNKTMVQPIQKLMLNQLSKIWPNAQFTIKPFSLN